MKQNDRFIEIRNPEDFLNNIEERDNLDYKKRIVETRQGEAGLIKDCAAIANNGGGVIIYGIDGLEKTGIPEADLKKYDPSRLHDGIKNYLSPVPVITTNIITFENKKFPFVKIAGIENSPIIISRQMNDEKNKNILKEGDIYIRHNTQTLKAQSEAHINHLLEQVTSFRVTKKLSELYPILNLLKSSNINQIIESAPQIEIEGKKNASDKVQITQLTPSRQFLLQKASGSTIFDKNKISEAFKVGFEISGYTVPHYTIWDKENSAFSKMNNGFMSFNKGRSKQEIKYLARVHEDGSFLWISSLAEDYFASQKKDAGNGFKNGVGVLITFQYILLSLFYTSEYLRVLEDKDDWKLNWKINNISGRKLIIEDSARVDFLSEKKTLENSIEVTINLSSMKLAKNCKETCFNILDQIYERFNWTSYSKEQMDRDFTTFSNRIKKHNLT